MKDDLTERERQAIDGALRGLTLAEIGSRLFLSQKTVYTRYLRRNMEATGISKIECPLFQITITKPVPGCVLGESKAGLRIT